MVPAVLLGLAVIAAITAVLVVLRRRWPGDHGVDRVRRYDRAALGYPALRAAPGCGRSLHVRRVHRVGHRGGRRSGHGLAKGPERPPETEPWRARSAMAVLGILVGWTVLSWQQAKVWRNGITLWGWAEGVHRNSPVVQNNLGWAWAQAGELQRAEVHARRAAQAWPHNPPCSRRSLGSSRPSGATRNRPRFFAGR